MHQFQIRPILHNYRAPPTILLSNIWVRVVVWECGKGQTDRQMALANILPRLCLIRNV